MSESRREFLRKSILGSVGATLVLPSRKVFGQEQSSASGWQHCLTPQPMFSEPPPSQAVKAKASGEIILEPYGVAQKSRVWKVKDSDSRVRKKGNSKTRNLSVSFFRSNDELKRLAMQHLKVWESSLSRYLVLHFRTDNDIRANIRISFDGNENWSSIGREALGVGFGAPTLNLGGVKSNLSVSQKAGVILHEFGHTLGLLHEHKHPDNGIQWNEPAVYKYFRDNHGKGKNWVKQEVLRPYGSGRDYARTTKLDQQSIMIYEILQDWTVDSFSTTANVSLSRQDVEFTRGIYGA